MQKPREPTEFGDGPQLLALASQWVRAMPFSSFETLIDPLPIPQELLGTITQHPASRQVALGDASLWFSCGAPCGLGMELAWRGGTLSVGPMGETGYSRATFEWTWVDRMDPYSQIVERRNLVFDALWNERGIWRVGRFFSDTDRAKHLQMLRFIKESGLR